MDLLKIVENEASISQITLLKQAGRVIENGPICLRKENITSSFLN